MRPTHKTTVPVPWLPLAWWQPARCPSPKRAALPGCGPTTWRTGTHGGVCKRNGGTPVEACAHRWPRGSITPPSPHGYRPTDTDPEGVGPAACQRRLMPLRLVKKGRCKAWQSSVHSGVEASARYPTSQPTKAARPSSCSRPVPDRRAAAPSANQASQSQPSKPTVASNSKKAFMHGSIAP